MSDGGRLRPRDLSVSLLVTERKPPVNELVSLEIHDEKGAVRIDRVAVFPARLVAVRTSPRTRLIELGVLEDPYLAATTEGEPGAGLVAAG